MSKSMEYGKIPRELWGMTRIPTESIPGQYNSHGNYNSKPEKRCDIKLTSTRLLGKVTLARKIWLKEITLPIIMAQHRLKHGQQLQTVIR